MHETLQQWKQESEMADLDNIELLMAFVNNILCLHYVIILLNSLVLFAAGKLHKSFESYFATLILI